MQKRSERFQAEMGSEVLIEPILPGCYCYPPEMSVRIERGEVDASFWVVPHVLGKLMEPRVVLRRGGEILAVVPLEITVARRTYAIATSIAGIFLPFGIAILKHLRLDFETQIKEKFGLYAKLLRFATNALSPELVAIAFLLSSLTLYAWCRPRRRAVFWDVTAVGPQEQLDLAIQAFEQGDQAKGVNLINSLLDTHPEFVPAWRYCGNWHYELGRFEDALYDYERCIEFGRANAKDYVKAARAASHANDHQRAYSLMKKAETQLPRESITPIMWYNLGCYASRVSKYDAAMDYLKRAVTLGYSKRAQFEDDPDLAPLHSRSDFKFLIARLK